MRLPRFGSRNADARGGGAKDKNKEKGKAPSPKPVEDDPRTYAPPVVATAGDEMFDGAHATSEAGSGAPVPADAHAPDRTAEPGPERRVATAINSPAARAVAPGATGELGSRDAETGAALAGRPDDLPDAGSSIAEADNFGREPNSVAENTPKDTDITPEDTGTSADDVTREVAETQGDADVEQEDPDAAADTVTRQDADVKQRNPDAAADTVTRQDADVKQRNPDAAADTVTRQDADVKQEDSDVAADADVTEERPNAAQDADAKQVDPNATEDADDKQVDADNTQADGAVAQVESADGSLEIEARRAESSVAQEHTSRTNAPSTRAKEELANPRNTSVVVPTPNTPAQDRHGDSSAVTAPMVSVFDTAIVNEGGFRYSEPVMVKDKLSYSPDVTVDADGIAWVAWAQTASAEAGEQIMVRRFDESGAGPALTAGTLSGVEMQPCIVTLAHGSIRIFWVARREDKWHLLTRSFRGRDFASETVVATSEHGLFNPRAAIDTSGTCRVVCERVEDGTTRLALFRQAKDTWVEEPLDTLDGDCHRPDMCLGPDDALWVAYDVTERGGYRVAIQSIPGSAPRTVVAEEETDGEEAPPPQRGLNPIVVADDGYDNVHPALARDGSGGLWIAFASNLNEARRDPAWLTKWSYVVHFDGERFTEPAGHRPGVDLYNEHAFQGWEFPAVVGLERRDDDGTTNGVDSSAGSSSSGDSFSEMGPGASSEATRAAGTILFGQSAHSILAQSYAGMQWSPAHTIVQRKWGSWKPRCRVAYGGRYSRRVFVVSMGLDGAQIQRVDVAAALDSAALTVPLQQRPTSTPRRETDINNATTRSGRRPSIESADGTEYNIYFGDLHAHSVYGDAMGDVDELYNRYRARYGYDFAALTEHDYLDGMKLSGSELSMIWNHADRASIDGEFIAWYGYEWTSPAIPAHAGSGAAVGEGHRHVLYPDDQGPLVRFGPEGGGGDAPTGAALLNRLRGVRALVIPHHTAWSGTDWEAHDDQLQRVIEIVSTHGRFEYPGNKPIGYRRDHVHPDQFAVAALERGYKLGFVGGSDSHGLRWHAIELEGRAAHIPHGTRVGWKEDAYRSGMTAILAEDLTRESLFQAVYNRRCYATSGVPIVLDFRVNGRVMGSEVVARIGSGETPRVSVRVHGTAPIRSVEVVRSGHVFGGLQMQPGEGISTVSFEVEDTQMIPGESHYFYVRVLQEDGEMAWASPIWVSAR